MNTRIYATIRWLRRSGSIPLLVAILASAAVSVVLIDDGGAAKPVAIVSMAALGVALVVGCLFAFPYAGIWHDDDHAAEPRAATPPAAAQSTPEDRRKFINELRTMLISIVVGAFALVTIYLTYVSAQAAARSANASEQQQRNDQLSSSGDLMNSDNAGVRLIGVATLRRLIDAKGVEAAEGYRALAVYVRDRAHWTKDKRERWDRLKKLEGRAAEDDARVGIGALRKRAPDVQAALSVVGSSKGGLPDKLDLRDADLQGAALGRAQLPGALFSGAHLDYLDVRTGNPPYANFAGAEFKGTGLYGAYFNNADLSKATFDTPIGAGGVLRTSQRTDLRHAHFRGARANGASFKAVDLRWANFTATRGRKATLRGADFSDAILTGADFEGADLTGADFRGAEIDGVNWKDAVLTGARFQYRGAIRP